MAACTPGAGCSSGLGTHAGAGARDCIAGWEKVPLAMWPDIKATQSAELVRLRDGNQRSMSLHFCTVWCYYSRSPLESAVCADAGASSSPGCKSAMRVQLR